MSRELRLGLLAIAGLATFVALLIVVSSLEPARPELDPLTVDEVLAEPDPVARWGTEELYIVGWYADLDEECAGDYELETGRVIMELFRSGGMSPEEAPGALVASHGPFVWGHDAAKAAEHAIAVELMAELALHTLALSPSRPPIGEALLSRHFDRKHGPRAYYGQR